MENKETSNYEIMAIFSPDLGEENTKKELDELKEIITSHGGNITHEDIWGLRDFAYTIKKYDQGYYVVFNFATDPSKIKELEHPLNLNQNVIRYLVTKTTSAYEIKTLAKYEEEAEAESQEEEKKNQDKEDEKKKAAAKRHAKKIVEKVIEKKEVKKEEKVKEEAPPKEVPTEEEAPKKKTQKLDDVDEKLKSIIDDPDITL